MRRMVRVAAGIAVASMSLVAASCGDDTTGPGSKTYVANLIGANEGAGRTSPGSGVATFTDLGAVIEATLVLTNMTAVIASHIHGPAAAGTNTGIIINLFVPTVATGTVNGQVWHGSITDANNANVSLDSLRVLFNNGNAYVNVHTSANPGGEIRDQVRPR